jgi:glycosyltransferase involved in cell wall biosynthesis
MLTKPEKQMHPDFGPISENPLVSVVAASLNQEDFIEETILSVLNQNHQNLELIIIDGTSTDGTLEVLHRYDGDPRVQWISEPDTGPNHAYNKGLMRAKGEVVGLQPSSDTYEPSTVGQAAREFVKDPLLAMVGGSISVMDEQGNPVGDFWKPHQERTYLSIGDITGMNLYPGIQATFFRRDLAVAIGGLDEDLQTNHTYFFLHCMLEAARLGGHSLSVPGHWGNFRRHTASFSDVLSGGGLRSAVELRMACVRFGKQYRDILSADQARSFILHGFQVELGLRVAVQKQIIPAIPALWGYLRYGGLTANRNRNLLSHVLSVMQAKLAGRRQRNRSA